MARRSFGKKQQEFIDSFCKSDEGRAILWAPVDKPENAPEKESTRNPKSDVAGMTNTLFPKLIEAFPELKGESEEMLRKVRNTQC